MAEVGQEFTHKYFFDPDWRPGPGQTYRQHAPKARMVVTRVSTHSVWYQYANGTSRFHLNRREFDDTYPTAAATPTSRED